ncbi:MAG: hypothetical protein RJB68_1436, partial [Pseudomonadota bacterium]
AKSLMLKVVLMVRYGYGRAVES